MRNIQLVAGLVGIEPAGVDLISGDSKNRRVGCSLNSIVRDLAEDRWALVMCLCRGCQRAKRQMSNVKCQVSSDDGGTKVGSGWKAGDSFEIASRKSRPCLKRYGDLEWEGATGDTCWAIIGSICHRIFSQFN